MRQQNSQPFKAAFVMLGAMFSFTLMAIAGRELAGNLDTFEIMMYRSFIGVLIVLFIAVASGKLNDINANKLGLHTLRNAVHFMGQSLWLYALIHIPLSQLFAFEFTHPLWVAILAPFLLGEIMTRKRIFAFVIGFLGILIVARPESAPITIATFAAVACAFMFALTTICTKYLGKTETTLSIMFWLTVIQAGFGLICAGYDGDIAIPPVNVFHWVAIVGLGGLFAHYCIATALKIAPASIVAPLEFLRLPLIAIVGFAFYDEQFLVSIIFGAVIVFCANFLNIREETEANKRFAEQT
ncbi:MAG: DMT family transporter [Amylibacter sp.]|nr:DMT family transporter [Amylibacter sp.]